MYGSGDKCGAVDQRFANQFLSEGGATVALEAMRYYASSSEEMVTICFLPLLAISQIRDGTNWITKNYHKISQFVNTFEALFEEKAERKTKAIYKVFRETFDRIQAVESMKHSAELLETEERERMRKDKKREKRRNKRQQKASLKLKVKEESESSASKQLMAAIDSTAQRNSESGDLSDEVPNDNVSGCNTSHNDESNWSFKTKATNMKRKKTVTGEGDADKIGESKKESVDPDESAFTYACKRKKQKTPASTAPESNKKSSKCKIDLPDAKVADSQSRKIESKDNVKQKIHTEPGSDTNKNKQLEGRQRTIGSIGIMNGSNTMDLPEKQTKNLKMVCSPWADLLKDKGTTQRSLDIKSSQKHSQSQDSITRQESNNVKIPSTESVAMLKQTVKIVKAAPKSGVPSHNKTHVSPDVDMSIELPTNKLETKENHDPNILYDISRDEPSDTSYQMILFGEENVEEKLDKELNQNQSLIDVEDQPMQIQHGDDSLVCTESDEMSIEFGDTVSTDESSEHAWSSCYSEDEFDEGLTSFVRGYVPSPEENIHGESDVAPMHFDIPIHLNISPDGDSDEFARLTPDFSDSNTSMTSPRYFPWQYSFDSPVDTRASLWHGPLDTLVLQQYSLFGEVISPPQTLHFEATSIPEGPQIRSSSPQYSHNLMLSEDNFLDPLYGNKIVYNLPEFVKPDSTGFTDSPDGLIKQSPEKMEQRKRRKLRRRSVKPLWRQNSKLWRSRLRDLISANTNEVKKVGALTLSADPENFRVDGG